MYGTTRSITRTHTVSLVRVTIYELSNDGSTTYDWYRYRTLDNIVPGKQLWGSAYVNDFVLAKYYPWQSSQALSDHDPLDDTTDPASVTLTVPPPSFSYTFPIPSIIVDDETNYGTDRALWTIDINSMTSTSAVSAYTAKPGFNVRISQGGIADV